MKVEWVGGNTFLIRDRIPRVDIRWWQCFPNWNMHGVAIRRVPLAMSDIAEMMHFVASDTLLVRWCFTTHCVLACSLSKGLSCAAGYYIEITFKLPQSR